MTQLQPDIMIVNSLYQDRCDAGTIGAHSVCENLVSHQAAFRGAGLIFFQALFDTFGKGFVSVGNTIDTIFCAEFLHTVFFAV